MARLLDYLVTRKVAPQVRPVTRLCFRLHQRSLCYTMTFWQTVGKLRLGKDSLHVISYMTYCASLCVVLDSSLPKLTRVLSQSMGGA